MLGIFVVQGKGVLNQTFVKPERRIDERRDKLVFLGKFELRDGCGRRH